ncbi:MAG: DUF350 domain-containing protein [Candidatus Latescibacteria bacterium]|nr:DUF350 domain-containing protein [Candidatus Latescibacterota bacterium]
MELINIQFVVNAVLFAVVGMVIFWASFVILDKILPYSLWHELLEEHNTALAILIGCIALGICIIIAAAIHG